MDSIIVDSMTTKTLGKLVKISLNILFIPHKLDAKRHHGFCYIQHITARFIQNLIYDMRIWRGIVSLWPVGRTCVFTRYLYVLHAAEKCRQSYIHVYHLVPLRHLFTLSGFLYAKGWLYQCQMTVNNDVLRYNSCAFVNTCVWSCYFFIERIRIYLSREKHTCHATSL